MEVLDMDLVERAGSDDVEAAVSDDVEGIGSTDVDGTGSGDVVEVDSYVARGTRSGVGFVNKHQILNKAKFPVVLSASVDIFCSPANIKGSFRKSGIFPYNPDAIDKRLLVPSHSKTLKLNSNVSSEFLLCWPLPAVLPQYLCETHGYQEAEALDEQNHNEE
jgi:hypothetical protein